MLFRPQTALRVRWNLNTDTPLPPDEPAGENPPDGAVIDYYLGASVSGPVTLEIRDESGQIVRHYSSTDPVPGIDPMLPVPAYWIRPAKGLSGTPGMHRFLWDMHYAPIPGLRPSYPISAVYRNTAPEPTSPWAMPGKYTVVLSANGKSYTRALAVQMDPRLKTSTRDLGEQFRLSKQLYDQWLALSVITNQIRAIRTSLAEVRSDAKGDEIRSHVDALNQKLGDVTGTDSPAPNPVGKVTIQTNTPRLRTLFAVIQGVDLAPTPQVVTA